jgi:hypothetical protein
MIFFFPSLQVTVKILGLLSPGLEFPSVSFLLITGLDNRLVSEGEYFRGLELSEHVWDDVYTEGG